MNRSLAMAGFDPAIHRACIDGLPDRGASRWSGDDGGKD
jgi:hypothetical protein